MTRTQGRRSEDTGGSGNKGELRRGEGISQREGGRQERALLLSSLRDSLRYIYLHVLATKQERNRGVKTRTYEITTKR